MTTFTFLSELSLWGGQVQFSDFGETFYTEKIKPLDQLKKIEVIDHTKYFTLTQVNNLI